MFAFDFYFALAFHFKIHVVYIKTFSFLKKCQIDQISNNILKTIWCKNETDLQNNLLFIPPIKSFFLILSDPVIALARLGLHRLCRQAVFWSNAWCELSGVRSNPFLIAQILRVVL